MQHLQVSVGDSVLVQLLLTQGTSVLSRIFCGLARLPVVCILKVMQDCMQGMYAHCVDLVVSDPRVLILDPKLCWGPLTVWSSTLDLMISALNGLVEPCL